MKFRHQRLMFAVLGCAASLTLFAACSDDDVLTPSGSSGSSGAGTAGTSGTASAGAAHGGASGASTQGGAPSAGAPSGGAGSGGAPSGGAPNGGAGTSGSGGATAGTMNGGGAGEPAGGEAGASEAGAGGEGGDGGMAGAGGALPISIPLLNADFEHGDHDVAGTVESWQTSGDLASYINYNGGAAHAGYGRLAMWRETPAYKVSTFQTVSGLTNGTYTLSAWVAGGSTGLNSVYLYAKGYGSVPTDQVKKDITPAGTYAQFSLTDIHVTSGTLTVGVYVDGEAGAWTNVDDVTLVRVQ